MNQTYKKKVKVFIMTFTITVVTIFAIYSLIPNAVAHDCATCSSKGKCYACKTCEYCKNCSKNSGSCSVCRK